MMNINRVKKTKKFVCYLISNLVEINIKYFITLYFKIKYAQAISPFNIIFWQQSEQCNLHFLISQPTPLQNHHGFPSSQRLCHPERHDFQSKKTRPFFIIWQLSCLLWSSILTISPSHITLLERKQEIIETNSWPDKFKIKAFSSRN